MQRLGIQTGADLRAKSLSFLQQHFGKSATWYLGITNGEDERLVVADRPRKSSGSETTFERLFDCVLNHGQKEASADFKMNSKTIYNALLAHANEQENSRERSQPCPSRQRLTSNAPIETAPRNLDYPDL